MALIPKPTRVKLPRIGELEMNPTAIIEVTEKCNLACNFCLRPSFSPPIMSTNVLEEIIAHILDFADSRADFVWHGGEPLLAGLAFFQQIPKLQKKYNTRSITINNHVQTNGTTLNRELVAFLENERFSIGTSIQGTQETHDVTRVTVKGSTTYAKVVSNISLLRKKPSSIIVLTTDLLGKEEDIYWQTKPLVSGMRVSEYFPGGLYPQRNANNYTATDRPEPLMPTAEEWGSSMIRFYEVWKNDPTPIDLRPITEIIRSFVVGRSEGCLYSQQACAHSVLGIKHTGDFYSCIRGASTPKFLIGNVRNKPLDSVQNAAELTRSQRVHKLLEGPCGSCRFWNYCNGGCPLESWKIYGDTEHRTWYCEGRKMLFERILADLLDSGKPAVPSAPSGIALQESQHLLPPDSRHAPDLCEI